jgi:hypothetical protein
MINIYDGGNMINAEEVSEKDNFWLYVIGVTVLLVGVIALIKMSENEKYDPIRKQLSEEAAQMNIRVLKEY